MPPTVPTSVHGRHSISLGAPRLPDDFLLAPPPGPMSLAGMYAPAPHQYVPTVYASSYPSLPPLASALAPSDSPIPSMIHRDALDNTDPMARIRAQADMLGRTTVLPNGALNISQPAPSADSSAAPPGLYAAVAGAQDGQYDRYSVSTSSQWDPPQAPYGARNTSQQSLPFPASGEPTLQSHPPASAYHTDGTGSFHAGTISYPSSFASHHGPPPHQHSRSDDVSSSEGDYGSDAGTASTHSIPSSANSSSVHLPLPPFNNLRTRAEMGGKDGYGVPEQGHHPQEGEGGFSSAFGLMSLDDPNVLAGLATDGQPFFSGLPFTPGASGGQSGLSLATPTQDLIAQLKGGREGGESKEMRDFWKQYLRTPLTGPNSSGVLLPLQTPTGPGVQLGQATLGGRPSPTRRHSRVNSLPSMKTPPLFAEDRLGSYQRPSTGDHYDSHGNNAPGQPSQGVAGGYSSTVRTTLHDTEDLKSYEQAVLARKAPINLNLVPRRKGSLANPVSAGPGAPLGKSKSMSPVVPHASFSNSPTSGASKISELLNRPGSTSSIGTSGSGGSNISLPSSASTTANQASSSLAHAFGGDHQGAQAADAAFRPSFKRLASQSLGPDNAKRALLGPAGWDYDVAEDEESERASPAGEESEDERRDVRMAFSRPFGGESRNIGLAAHGSI